MTPEYINEMITEIHQQNKEAGWWTPDQSVPLVKAQLIITEVCEATEGLRKDLMDDHLSHRKMEEVELADALIRTLDLAGFLGIRYIDDSMLFHELEIPENPAVMHLFINSCVIAFAMPFTNIAIDIGELLSTVVYSIIKVAEKRGFDIKSTMEEKLEYNKQRLDHKQENRAKDGGKKF